MNKPVRRLESLVLWLALAGVGMLLSGCAAPPTTISPAEPARTAAAQASSAVSVPAGATPRAEVATATSPSESDHRPPEGASTAPPPRAGETPEMSPTPDPVPSAAADEEPIERGRASWYGGRFHGRRTANGERYDMHAMTAAHKTLPFGTVVRVKSLVNGREVQVRINDRGPFVRGRIIDLSRAAAEALGLLGLGHKDVELLWAGGVDLPVVKQGLGRSGRSAPRLR